MSTRALPQALALVVLVVIAVLALVLGSLAGGELADSRSASSPDERGSLAAYLLLRELGWTSSAWSEAPGELPRARVCLWLADVPPEPPAYLRALWEEMDEDTDEGAAGPPASTRRLRDPRQYRRFVEEGGVLLTALDKSRRSFLLNEAGFVELEGVEAELLEQEPARQRVVTRDGGTLELGWGGQRSLNREEPGPDDPATQVLAADAAMRTQAVALKISIGSGELVLLPEDSLFANASIGDADNALLLVRLLEGLGPLEAVYFDEYALGGWVPDSALQLALAPRRLAFTAHLLALLALLVWYSAWTGSFPRDPEPLAQASPRARARAQGALLERYGRWDMMARHLRRGVLGRLSGGGRRLAIRGEQDTEREVQAALATVAHLARDESELGTWRQAFSQAPVARPEELERLAHTLTRLQHLAHGGSTGQNQERQEELHDHE